MTQRDTMMGHLLTSCRLTCSSFADMLPKHEGGNHEPGNGPVKTPDIWSVGKTVVTLQSTTEPLSRGRTVQSHRLPQGVVVGSQFHTKLFATNTIVRLCFFIIYFYFNVYKLFLYLSCFFIQWHSPAALVAGVWKRIIAIDATDFGLVRQS